jgi:hypothetical protein
LKAWGYQEQHLSNPNSGHRPKLGSSLFFKVIFVNPTYGPRPSLDSDNRKYLSDQKIINKNNDKRNKNKINQPVVLS